MDSLEYRLRDVDAGDRACVIDLIDGVYREYGETICLEDADSDLRHLPQHYLDLGGRFVVMLLDQKVVGCHAAHPIEKRGVCTFRRLYLDPQHRGGQAGQRLMQWAIDWARSNAFVRVEFWSDTRFHRAHRFFQKYGFQSDGQVREMSDGWEDYQEFFFWMDLPPIASA